MDWKLGISMSSNTCRALNSPYVTLVFTVVTDVVIGTTKQYSVELCMQQFQVTIATSLYINYVNWYTEFLSSTEGDVFTTGNSIIVNLAN